MYRDDTSVGYIVKETIKIFLLFGAGYFLGYRDARIPNIDHVQPGSIAPSRLEIQCEDLDGNGEIETIIRVDNRPYRLEHDENGNPRFAKYETRPIPNKKAPR